MKTSNTSIIIGIKGEHESFRKIERAKYQKKSISNEFEKDMRPGRIISRLDHPVTFSYNGDSVIIPPKGCLEVADIKKIGALPRGVVSLNK